jgi:hypothetical protein
LKRRLGSATKLMKYRSDAVRADIISAFIWFLWRKSCLLMRTRFKRLRFVK